MKPLTLSEQLLLLALKDEKGTVVSSASIALDYGLIGALLMELAMADRIAVRDRHLGVLKSEATGDDLLDELMAHITGRDGKPKAVRYWLPRLARKIKKLRHRVAERLVNTGILRREDRRILGIFPSVRYPTVNPLPELEVREKLKNTILMETEPGCDVVVLASLLKACNLVTEVFDKRSKKQAMRRLKKLSADEPIAKAVGETVAAVQAAVTASITAAIIASSSAR